MSVGSNIRKRRIELGLSQQELADAMGFKTRSSIAKIESGANDISQSKLIKLSGILCSSIEAIITGNFTPIVSGSNDSIVIKENSNSNTSQKNNLDTVAVLLAGGRSTRSHQDIPNQFIAVNGKPIFIHCLESYQNHPAISQIYVVCLNGWESIVQAYAKQYGISKLTALITAGETGIKSIKNSVEYLQDKISPDTTIVFQESTRPMISVDTISKVIQRSKEKGSAITCKQMNEVVQFEMLSNDSTEPSEGHPNYRYIDRNSLYCVLSPDAHRLGNVIDAFDKAERENHPLEESCLAMFLYNLGLRLEFCEGEPNNIKIVRSEDISMFATILKGMEE